MPEVTDKKGVGVHCHWNVRHMIISKSSLFIPSLLCYFFQPGWLVSILDGCLCYGEDKVQEKCISMSVYSGGVMSSQVSFIYIILTQNLFYR